MKRARSFVIVLGIVLPYLARIPGCFLYGPRWLASYLNGGLAGILLIGIPNLACWATILAFSCLYRSPASLILPAFGGFGFLAYAHGTLDLASDAQAALALLFIPFYAVPYAFVGGLIGLLFDRRLFSRFRYTNL